MAACAFTRTTRIGCLLTGLVVCLAGCGGSPKDIRESSPEVTTPENEPKLPPEEESPQSEPPTAAAPTSESPIAESPAEAAPAGPPTPSRSTRFDAMKTVDRMAEPAGAEPVGQPDSEPKEKVLFSVAPGETESGKEQAFRRVDVFYATDRAPADRLDAPGLIARFGPIMAAGSITLVFALGAWFFSRRVLLAVVVFGGVLICLGWFQSQRIDARRLARLVEHGNRTYGSSRHENADGYQLEVGKCEVTIPMSHTVGKLEAPSVFKLEFSETPERHVILQKIVCQPEDVFYRELHDHVDGSRSKQAMVFVHGYNVAFDDAVRRTAQIASDVGFDGAPICYSWPSLGDLADYTRDENNVEWTVVHLEDFLNRVVQDSGATMVHLVAHSMGNRALLQTLERMAPRRQTETPVFGQVVLAAPDVDASAFRERYAPAAIALSRQVTLYASSSDRALLASTKVHGYTRAGLAGEGLVAIPQVETVDVSGIDTTFLGHSYYGNNPLLIKDLQALVEMGAPAAKRDWLRQILKPPSIAWWTFRETEAQQTGDNDDGQ